MNTIYHSLATSRFWLLTLAMLFLVTLAVPVSSASVENAQDGYFLKNEIGVASSGTSQEKIFLESDFKLKTGTRKGLLTVTAEVLDAWHIFSITQPEGGPIASKISVAESKDYRLLGKFVALDEPHSAMSDVFKIMVEEHEGEVRWVAPIEIAEGVDAKNVEIEVVYNGQACESKPNGQCVIIFDTVSTAAFDGFDPKLKLPVAKKKVEIKPIPFAPEELHVILNGTVTKVGDGPISAGDSLKLTFMAESTDHYHVYAYGTPKDKAISKTLIGFKDAKAWNLIGPQASEEPEMDDSLGEDLTVYYHEQVTWTFDLKVPANAKAGDLPLTGAMLLQTCDDSGCDPPLDIAFTANIPVGGDGGSPIKFKVGKGGAAEELANSGGMAKPAKNSPTRGASNASDSKVDGLQNITAPTTGADSQGDPKYVVDTPEEIAAMAKLYQADETIQYLKYPEMATTPIGAGKTSSASDTTLLYAFGLMFLGGMLLNLMPCVFPVLGIKVMGFVKLGGEDNAKVRAHGMLFGLGLIVSMWVLAGTLLIIKAVSGDAIQWGAQMGNPYFVGIMIVFLFVFGLNMAGIFEIGTSMSSVGGKATTGGGYSASFMSGILTTLIATPCSGPFLGSAMGVALGNGTSPLTTMALFTVFGFGIAIPYIILSFFPPLIKSLPKPGPWMDTFKVTMAFALFATCAFFMQTFGQLTGANALSWFVMALVIIGLAAFFFGSFGEPHIKAGKRIPFGYIMPALIAGVGCWLAFGAMSNVSTMIETQTSHGGWAKWHPGKVEHIVQNKQRIVWVDYTADW